MVEVRSPEKTDIEILVDRIKKELAKGASKSTVIQILEKDGWDKGEASEFVGQIALELATNPEDLPLVINRYKGYLLQGAVTTIIILSSGLQKLESAGLCLLVGSLVAVRGLAGWLVYEGRLAFRKHELTSQAVTFRPTKGNLNFPSTAWYSVTDGDIAMWVVVFLGALTLMFVLDHFIK